MRTAELDLGAVRAFVAVAECRHFGDAADRLGISQQAVSKRIARLETDLGTTLLSRTRAGTELSRDGSVFLPHARALLAAADGAVAALGGGVRPLRVDVLDTRLASVDVVRAFYDAGGRPPIDVVTSAGLRSALRELPAGSLDVAFARVSSGLDGIESVPAYLDPVEVLVGAGHPLAARGSVSMAELAGVTVWMPGNVAGSEWADFYDAVGAEFGVHIDTSGPDFGWEAFVAGVCSTDDRVGFVGGGCRLPPHSRAVRLPVSAPRPVYPCSVLWHRDNRHPEIPRLVRHVRARFRPADATAWLPEPDRAAFSRHTQARHQA